MELVCRWALIVVVGTLGSKAWAQVEGAPKPTPVVVVPAPTIDPGEAKGFAPGRPGVIIPIRGEQPMPIPNDGGVVDVPALPDVAPRLTRPEPVRPTMVYGPPPGAILAGPIGGDSGFAMMLKFKPGDEHLLQMESQNGLFKFFVGGRLQIDGTLLKTNDTVQAPRAQGGIGQVNDAVNFRRARFDFGGTFYKNIDFLMELDFINTVDADRAGELLPIDTPVPTDLNITFKELPAIGNLRVGNMKNPVALEHLTSSRFLNFMERSLAFDAFVENQNNGFEPGIMAFNTAFDDRMTWALGVFKNTRNIFGWNTGDGEYDLTGRITALPIYENDGEQLVHVGLGFSHRDMDDGQERLRTRLLVRDGPAVLHNIVAEARMIADSRFMVVPEIAAVYGPWTFAAELYCNWVKNAQVPVSPNANRTNVGTAYFNGGYLEALYFITGEHRAYNRKTGAFWRVTPRSNFSGFTEEACDECDVHGHGPGAWQVALRYSWVDLDYRAIRGGSAQDLTLGLNWFLNPYVKLQWNYTALYRNAPNPAYDGWVHGLGTRIAFDF